MHALSALYLLLPLTLSSLPQTLAQTDPFSPDYASCAADPGVFPIMGPAESSRQNVTVQPYCDNAINTICNTALDTMKTRPTIQSLKATGVDQGDIKGSPCQVHLLFPTDTVTFNGFNYDTCVQAFQSITVDCMLIGTGKWAQAYKQAGVRGVAHDAQGEESSVARPIWKAASLSSPGYMAGPLGYFGNVSVLDISTRIPENVYWYDPVRYPLRRRSRRSSVREGGVEL